MSKKFPLRVIVVALAAVFSGTLPFTTFAQVDSTSDQKENNQQKPVEKEPSKRANETAQKVIINGSVQSDVEERRRSTASKIIFGREELDRNGDSSLGEVLKRLPGVTIGGRPGRGGDIRMRGMGSGYTQVLLNGERPPRGFSMDTLSPDQVERIEIIRGPVAEYSTQAIAGTINIILREDYRQKKTELKISDGLEQGRSAPNISLTYPGQVGNLSYALSASVFQNRQRDETYTNTLERSSLGQLSLLQDETDETQRRTRGIHVTPRLSYKLENGDTLIFQPFLMNSRSDSTIVSQIDQSFGVPAQFALANGTRSAENSFVRGFGNWQHKFANNAKLTIKFGGGVGTMESSSFRTQYDTTGKLLDTIIAASNIRDSSFNTGGKYTLPLGDSHTLATGWDVETGKRNETSSSLDNGKPQFDQSGNNLDASTRRLAAFIQDEFDINAQWSAYAGLRWEGIRTSSTTSDHVVNNASSVWSPLLHGVWRIPGMGKDQIRMSLTNSYRAPGLNDLIALPSISQLNSPTKPDRTGNPNLKPEMSKGVDLAYEHYLSRAGIMSANFFMRSIDDLIRRNTELVATSTGSRWVSSPVNIGHATTRGVELEAKFQLQEFFPEGPAIDVRSNYSRFWSSVDDIQGPNNRIDQQPKQTANFGLDYRSAKLPITLGGSVNWTPAYVIQSSDTQINGIGIKRQLDLYGLWKISPTVQLRLSANNLTANDYLTSSTVTTGGIYHVDNVDAKTYTTWTLKLELKI